MEVQIQLYIREHHNRHYTIEVIGDSSIQLYATDLEQGREDLYLVLNDKLERLHPGHQGRYAASKNQTHEVIDIKDFLKVEGRLGLETFPTKVSVVITQDRKWQRLWFPRWNCHYWIPKDANLEESVGLFVHRHLLKKMSIHEKLQHRYERKEWVEDLIVEAEPPALEAFLDGYLEKEYLPYQLDEKKKKKDKKDKDDEEEEEKKKKKRPPTPTLKKIASPIHELAKENELEHAYGRDKELTDLLQILSAPGGNALVLVGKSGVGKTTILNELAYKVRSKDQHESMRTRPIWFVDASRLVAGEGFFGDWQRQCLDVIQECINAEVIWYVGNLLPLLDAGKSIGSDQNVSFLLRPYLAGNRLTIIGECTPQAWSQLELKDIGFARHFTPYHIEDPSEKEIGDILRLVSKDLHEEKDVQFDKGAQLAVLEFSRRYNSENSLLGNALHFLRRIADEAEINEKTKIARPDVVQQFCSETGLPEFLVRDDLPLDPESIWMTFQKRLIGQEEAVRRMTDLVAMIKSGLSDLNRPLGSFLFVGPTGVGKTEMAKTLTKYLFGREDRLIRFDMSEFVSPDSIHRFLGDGQTEGKLVSQIRRTPFAVLLLDEIEKAHPAVFDVLLQVLGEARLSDESGRSADFRNAVVLMTSNLGVSTMRRQLGFGDEQLGKFREHFIAEAEQFFRPEFFNRIDYIIPFFPLEREAIERITHREIDKFLRREGVRQRNISLDLHEDLPDWLAERGVDPRYGARPLKRVIESQLSAPLARHLSGLATEQHHTVQAQPTPSALSFVNLASSQRRKEKGQARTVLQRTLYEIGIFRFQAKNWRQTSHYRELVQEVKLFDRLSQDKNFWLDKRMAEDRMNDIKQARTFLEEFEGLIEQIASIEDLCYELYYDRNLEPLEMIEHDIKQIEESLIKLEMELFAQRFKNPHRATIYYAEDRNSTKIVRGWVKMYLDIAEKNGWKVRLYSTRRLEDAQLKDAGIDTKALITEQDLKKQKSKERQLQKEARQKDESEEKPLKPVKQTKEKKFDTTLERLRQVWRYVGSFHPEIEKPDKAKQDLLSELYTLGEDAQPKAMVFEGPFVACLLFGETGAHQHISDNAYQIRALYKDQNPAPFDIFAHPLTEEQAKEFPTLQTTELIHPFDLDDALPSERRRSIHEGKKLVKDFHLDLQHVLEPRVFQSYLKFMRANIYYTVFGPDGIEWFNREG